MFARFAEAGGLELRIFARDGQRFSGSPEPSPAESPNADLMAQFLNRKAGGPFQSLPVAAFFTDGMRYLYHYTEYPAIYEKDRVRGVMETPKPGETPEQTAARWPAEFAAFQESPFFQVVAEAAADEMIMALHRRLFIGAV